MSNLFFMTVADWTEKYSDTSERLFLGTTMVLIGMTIVVVMLVLISFSIRLLPLVLGSAKRRAEARSESIASPATRPFAPVPVLADADEMDGQLIAVITAALAATLSTGEYAAAVPSSGFRVRRIRRLR